MSFLSSKNLTSSASTSCLRSRRSLRSSSFARLSVASSSARCTCAGAGPASDTCCLLCARTSAYLERGIHRELGAQVGRGGVQLADALVVRCTGAVRSVSDADAGSRLRGTHVLATMRCSRSRCASTSSSCSTCFCLMISSSSTMRSRRDSLSRCRKSTADACDARMHECVRACAGARRGVQGPYRVGLLRTHLVAQHIVVATAAQKRAGA